MRSFKTVALLLCLLSTSAFADAVRVKWSTKAVLGQDLPWVQVEILEPITGFHLLLTRNDGEKVDQKGGGKPGTTRVIKLPQPEGTFSYDGELTIDYPNGDTGALPLKFDTEVLGPLKIDLQEKDVDLEHRRLSFRLSRPAKKAHLQVLMDTGKVVVDQDVVFNGEPAGTPLPLQWPAAEGRVMKIDVRAWDTSNFYTGMELSPWRVDIPHEDVLFDTARSEIRADQRKKLDQSFAAISEVVRRYGKLAELRLFVAGHTDTVGDAEHNKALSLKRARSIAQYFKRRGLRIPILFDGLGEDALLVGTADETAEEKNRRAEYIVAIDDPTVKGSAIHPSWQRL